MSHNGNITMYNAEELQTAIDASVDGDTLFLNEGTFSSTKDVNISKKISLIGAGESTIVSNNIVISTKGVLTSIMLDGMTIIRTISVSYSVDNLIIRKCKFWGFNCPNSSTYKLNKLTIDRCNINIPDSYYSSYDFEISSSLKNAIIKNTIIGTIVNHSSNIPTNVSDVTFVNCNVGFGTRQIKAQFINCLVLNNGDYAADSYFINCCLAYNYSTKHIENCTINNSGFKTKYEMEEWSSDLLGQDGTPVGITGGTTPYTLIPTSPKMESYSLNVDSQKRKLNVNIKMTAN